MDTGSNHDSRKQIEEVDPECRHYIKKATWEQIEERDNEKDKGDPDKQTYKLSSAIKRQVRADKKNIWQINSEKTEKILTKITGGKAVKNPKGKFSPKFIQMRKKTEC